MRHEDEIKLKDTNDSVETIDENYKLETDDSDEEAVNPVCNMTFNNAIEYVTDLFIEEHKSEIDQIRTHKGFSDKDAIFKLEKILLDTTNEAVAIYNSQYDVQSERKPKWDLMRTLNSYQLSKILHSTYSFKNVNMADEATDEDLFELMVYNPTGYNKGVYTSSLSTLKRIIRSFNKTIKKKEVEEVIETVTSMSEVAVRNENRALVAVENGIFNYDTKQLMDFDPDIVFVSKSKVKFNPNAKNKIIYEPDGNKWDVETWFSGLDDDPEIVYLLWQITGAIIRSGVVWNKTAWLYSSKGNNGKGTLVTLMRNICGKGSYASIPLSAFGEKFELEPIVNASAIITDENEVGQFIDKGANLKASITGDVFTVTRKYKKTIPFKFRGFMVQCLNEFPRSKDKTESFYRRQIIIHMEKRFEGVENKAIKTEYLYDQDVLEYVLYKLLVLMPDYYEFDIPAKVDGVLDEYKRANDPIREFWFDHEADFQWDLLPYDFLYQVYVAWYKLNVPGSKPVAKQTFTTNIATIADQSLLFKTSKNPVTTGAKLDKPEPLLSVYQVAGWSPKQGSADPTRVSSINFRSSYRGIVRSPGLQPSNNTDN